MNWVIYDVVFTSLDGIVMKLNNWFTQNQINYMLFQYE